MTESTAQLRSGRSTKRFTRRGFLGATFGAAGAVALAGVQGSDAAPRPASATRALVAQDLPFAGKSIRYQQRDSGAEDFVRNVFAPRFTEETGCEVVLEDIPQAELFSKVQVMAAAGQLGDLVFGFDDPWMVNWASRGILRGLNDLAEADGYVAEEQFYPGAVEALRVDGELYGLTTAGHPGFVNLYFNKTMFDEAGIAPPDATWTWDNVLAAAQALTKDTNGDGTPDVWGFLPAKFSGRAAAIHARQFGTDTIADDGLSTPIGNEQGQATYRYLHDLTYLHKVSPTPADIPPDTNTERVAGQYFAPGIVAMFEDATILITTMGNYDVPFEWGIYPIPAGPGGSRGATFSLNTTSVTASSNEPEASWEFLKLICSQEAGSQKLLMNSGSPGVRPDVFQDPEVQAAFPWFAVGHEVMLESKRSNVPANYRSTEVNDAILQIEGEIWLDEIGPEDGAIKLQETIQGILEEPA